MIDSKRSIEACAQSYGSDADAMRDYLSEGEKTLQPNKIF